MNGAPSRRSVLIAAAAAATAFGPARADGAPPPARAGDRVLGRANAPVTVIEYASFACPTCARWHGELFAAFKTRFVDTGRVRFVFREFKTPPENVAVLGAAIAGCAAPAQYFDTASALFAAQAEVYRTGRAAGPFVDAAASAGVDPTALSQCVSDAARFEALEARLAEHERHGVTGTPTFFVNGRVLPLSDAFDLDKFDAAIRAAARGG